jgi:exosortase
MMNRHPESTDDVSAAAWRGRGLTVAAAAFVAVALVLAYGHIVTALGHDWLTDENYSHGLLVVPIVGWLVWRQRHALRALERTPSLLGFGVIVGSLAVYVGGVLGAEVFTSRLSLLGVLAGGVLFVFGWRHLRLLLFPLGLLLLTIPLPAIVFNQITFPLQLLASWFGGTALEALHIPVLREGNIITLSTTTLYVAEACSGIRSLMSLVTLAILYGYFTDPRGGVRVAVALAAVPTAVVANGARIALTGVAASFIGPEAAEGALHMFSGWVLFVVALLLLVLIKRAIVLVAGRPAVDARAGLHPMEALPDGNGSLA